MGKRHLKRISAPRTWPIPRKTGGRFIIKPLPGGQVLEHTLPLGVILRDLLKKANTRKEVKRILHERLVEVDCRTRRRIEHPVGLFDTIRMPTIKEAYRVILDKHGKLGLIEIPLEEAEKKIVRINVKKHIHGGDLQLGLSDGRTMIIKKEDKDKYKVGDSLLIKLPSQEVLDHYKPEKDSWVYIFRGKHAGKIGILQEIEEGLIILKVDEEEIRTRKDYGIVISHPGQEPVIRLVE